MDRVWSTLGACRGEERIAIESGLYYAYGMINFKAWTARRTLISIASLVVIALVVVGTWLLASHQATTSSNGEVSQTVSRVCSGDIVKSYNAIASNTAVPVPNYKPVYDRVNALHNWRNDANCVYIALQYAIYSQDITQSRSLLDQLNKLDDQGLSVSNTLTGVQSRAALEQIVTYSSQASSTTNTTERGL
jgi:hypothetical protein